MKTDTVAKDISSKKRRHAAYKHILLGVAPENHERVKKYVTRYARTMEPHADESLQKYIGRVKTAVHERMMKSKTSSPVPMDISASKSASQKVKAKTKKRAASKSLTPMDISASQEKPTKKVRTQKKRVKVQDPLAELTSMMTKMDISPQRKSNSQDELVKLFGKMSLARTKRTTKKKVVPVQAARPIARPTSRQASMIAAKAAMERKLQEEKRRIEAKKAAKRTARKEKQEMNKLLASFGL